MNILKTGTMVVLVPEESPTVQLHFVVTHSNTGAVQLWNGENGLMNSRPYLTQQPDGLWANGSGIRYRLDVVNGSAPVYDPLACPQCGMTTSHSHHSGSVHGPVKE